MTITSNSSEKMINLGPSEKPSVKPSDFEFLRTIGKGSFGKVFSARHKKEDTIYAIKVLNKKMILKRNEKNHIMSERNVLLKNLNHPFLVGLYYSFQTKDKLYFVLDYVNGGEVSRWLLAYSSSFIFHFPLAALFPPLQRTPLYGAASEVLRRGDHQRHWLPALPGHHIPRPETGEHSSRL